MPHAKHCTNEFERDSVMKNTVSPLLVQTNDLN